MSGRSYYEAYDERYLIAHAAHFRWMGDVHSAIVSEVMHKYEISAEKAMLELGCGEGRDAAVLLKRSCNLLATDVSPEAIRFCRETMPEYADHFQVLDCVKGTYGRTFDFIYAIALLHMLVSDEDRQCFYRFIRDHLSENGIALIGSMGDGEREMQSDTAHAFDLQERNSPIGKIKVTATSCRIVSFRGMEREIKGNGLQLIEKGICAIEPEFDSMMYAVVRKK